MAKVLLGSGVSGLSGTFQGVTYQNWRGITTMRRKPTPTNVMSDRQTKIRAIISELSKAWRDVLTPGLRTAWEQRAKNYPWFDVFGREIKMSGINLYVKQNLVLLDHGLTRQDQPAPEVIPPECVDLQLIEDPHSLIVHYPQLSTEIVAAQAPFLDIWVAGGYLSAVNEVEPDLVTTRIESQALPGGRVHQRSDFRHAIYVSAPVPSATPDINRIEVTLPPAAVNRNIVISVQRYNKYGNFSVPRIFNAIRSAEV